MDQDDKKGKGGKGGVEVQSDFDVEPKSFNAPAAENYEGLEVSVNVIYEPSTLGEATALLIVTSPEGGEYQCTLQGGSTFP